MSTIDPLSSASIGSPYYSGSSALGKEDFLKLLITQLQYQDPLSPLENTEFMAQLAQFSSLEQLQNVNSNLQTNLLLTQSLNNSLATNLIGKRIVALGKELYLTGKEGLEITFDLVADGGVTVKVYDDNGNLVRTLKPGALPSGRNRLPWDGKDSEGNSLPLGNYSFQVEATDSNGNSLDVTTYSTGLVTGVKFEDGNAVLMLGDQGVDLSDIIEILTP